MAMTIDWPNKTISVPQGDLTLISGTLYEMDTEDYFRTELMKLADDEQGMAWPVPYQHNTEVTVAGVTYARVIEIINGYKVQFTPDSQWTVRLSGSNNNVFDVQNGVLVQNQVQVIPTNSAGLQTVTSGSGVTQQDKDDIENQIFTRVVENSLTFEQMYRVLAAAAAGSVVQQPDGSYVIKGIDGTTDRIEGDDAANNGRTITDIDGS